MRVAYQGLLSGMCALWASHAVATTYYVATAGDDGNSGLSWGSPVETIGAALAKATASNDVVIVSNGTYIVTEPLVVSNAVMLCSTNGPDVTIIDANDSSDVIRVTHSLAVLTGFTIQDGMSTSNDIAGGVTVYGGTVSNCIIRQNDSASSRGGGGIGIWDNALVVGCQIYSNRSTLSGTGGGGVFLRFGVISNCVIRHNEARAAGDERYFGGGGIFMSSASGTVYGCTIVSNSSVGTGGGIIMGGGAARVENCTIAFNSSVGSGGGILVDFGQYIRGCLILSNTCAGISVGGGIRLSTFSGSCEVENCTIVNNRAGPSGNGDGIMAVNVGSPDIRNCIIVGNGVDDVSGSPAIEFSCIGESIAGVGNISSDPQFENPAAGDFRLQYSSPCLDVGSNLTWMAAATDLDGNARVLGGTNDMGAYELDTSVGAVQCRFTADPATSTNNPEWVTLTAEVAGANTTIVFYGWDFDNNGSVDATGAVVSNLFSGWGCHAVSLIVSNDIAESDQAVQTEAVCLAPEVKHTFAASGGPHIFPYDTWSRAASNIQDAVDVLAGEGPYTVSVSNGTYYIAETLTISKPAMVEGIGGPAACVLDGGRTCSVVLVSHSNAALTGFTVQNGLSPNTGERRTAGGATVHYGLVSNCTIRTSTGDQNGGGGLGVWNNGTVVDSRIVSNTNRSSAVGAGGIMLAQGLVENCVISNNNNLSVLDERTYGGGGVVLRFFAPATLRNCVVVDNVSAGSGGGVLSTTTGAQIENCVISRNTSVGSGGGIFLNTADYIRGCLVTENTAGIIRKGGGLHVHIFANCEVENCTISTNTAGTTGWGAYLGAAITMRNCIIYGNGGDDYDGNTNNVTYSCIGEVVAGEGNTTSDPLFKSRVAGDDGYGLKKNSPLINAGTNQAWITTNTLDLAGSFRLDEDSLVVDMGAFEAPAPPPSGMVIQLR